VADVAEGRTYRPGQPVFRQGDPTNELLVVVYGRVAVSLISPGGNELIVNLIDPVQVVGEIAFVDGGPRTASGYCVRETRALLLPRRTLLPFLEREPTAAHALLLILCARLRQTTAFAEDLALKRLPSRLLARIEFFARRYGRMEADGSLRIDHGLSQRELGDSVGASRVAVNQQLNAWRIQGHLEFGRGFVIVHDMARLEASLLVS
jgi:CRP-like cAMP-binding protein